MFNRAMRLLGLFVAAGAIASAAHGQAVPFQNATATFSQTFTGDFSAASMIDGDLVTNANGWAIFNNGVTAAQTVAVETITNLTAPAIQLDMYQLYGSNHTLGRFRFSVTSDDRSLFCDGLQTGGNVTANWTVIIPTNFLLPSGVTYAVLGDGSVLIAGNSPATAIYSGLFDLPFGNITGLRMEVIEDPSLSTNGPGRQTNGNFVLTELVGTAVPTPASAAMIGAMGLLANRRRRR